MLPSWIRSRNWRPRLVYFLAIEITRRKLASTISFFARRAFASPIDMRRLMSLISAITKPVSCSTWFILLIQRSISSWFTARSAAYGAPDLTASCNHALDVSLPANALMKSFFGIFALTTQNFITRRSWIRTLSIISRMFLTMRSNCFGTKRNSLKTSLNALICVRESAWARPFFSITSRVLRYCSRSSVKRSRANSGSTPLSSSSLSSSSSSSSSSSNSSSDNSEPTWVAVGARSCSSLGSTKPEMMSLKRISSAS